MPFTRPMPVRHEEQVEPDRLEPAPAAAGGEDLVEGTDELLDEIDAILEEQAVLTSFRQRSGQ